MATMQRTGFLDRLGIGSVDEATRAQQINNQGPQSEFTALGLRLGRQASGVGRGLMQGIGGLITGEDDGRTLKGFVGNLEEGASAAEDQITAIATGVPVEQLRSRRKVRELVSKQQPGDDSLDSRTKLLQQIAKIANETGDVQMLAGAMEQMSQLDRERAERRKIGLETQAKQTEQDIGMTGRLVTEPKNTVGKMQLIETGPQAGMYLYINDKGEQTITDGSNFVPTTATNANKSTPVAQTVRGLAITNVGGTANLPKARTAMSELKSSARIVGNISDVLTTVNDPGAVLSLSGRAAITGDKSIALVESISSLFNLKRGSGEQTAVTWDGKLVSPGKQREEFRQAGEDGVLEDWLNSKGLDTQAALPAAIRGNALAAEQYWSNVMELAYLDARLQEPSNRGLSDKDITAALQRIGADTANPVSFAIRQKELIDGKLIPQLQNLGREFSTFDTDGVSKQEIVDAVFDPEIKEDVLEELFRTSAKLDRVIARGARGDQAPDASAAGQALEPDMKAFIDNLTLEQINAIESGDTTLEELMGQQ